MYSEEETELRDLILQNLEKCGFLSKIKAELRAGVFLALEEDGNLKDKIPLFNKNFDDFAVTFEGKLLLSLVREFLEFFNLHFTLSVFDPEVAATTSYASRSELCDHFKLNNSQISGPIMSVLLKEKINEAENQESNSSAEQKSVLNESAKFTLVDDNAKKSDIDVFNNENIVLEEKSCVRGDFAKDNTVPENLVNDIKETLSTTDILFKSDNGISTNDSFNKAVKDTLTEKNDESDNFKGSNIFEDAKNMLSPDHDPFFDEPLPSEKPSFLSFTDISKDKSGSKLFSEIKKDEPPKNSLSSLRDLPSLTANNEWTFSRDPLSTLPSLESQKSISSSEASNEEIMNLDSRENFQKKDSDVAESNEESSEKQNSEESIEEEIDDDFSAGFDDLLNSSLSLADDVTTDQTVSQGSVLEGVDHAEPCNS